MVGGPAAQPWGARSGAQRLSTRTPPILPSGNAPTRQRLRPRATYRRTGRLALRRGSARRDSALGRRIGMPQASPLGDASACHRLRPQATHRRTGRLALRPASASHPSRFWIFSCRLLACGRSSGRADTKPKGKIAARRSRPEGESVGAPLGGPRAKPLACRCVA